MPEIAVPPPPPAIILKCVAGKDNHRRIAITERPKRIAHASLQPDLPVGELDGSQGYLIARREKDVLLIDASCCGIPVLINNKEIVVAPMHSQIGVGDLPPAGTGRAETTEQGPAGGSFADRDPQFVRYSRFAGYQSHVEKKYFCKKIPWASQTSYSTRRTKRQRLT
jgi:hypothetical protein